MNRSTVTTFIKSESFPKVLTGIGIALGVIVIFEAGVAVGRHEGVFSSRWGQNYERNFGGSSMNMDGHGPMANGALGKVLQVSSSTILIADQNNQEQRVVLTDDTIIRDHETTVASTSIAVGTFVIVLGEPNMNGEIEAKLIRVIPAPPALSSSTPNTQ
jgi:hypothetical protein